jgi:hypothetical protein
LLKLAETQQAVNVKWKDYLDLAASPENPKMREIGRIGKENVKKGGEKRPGFAKNINYLFCFYTRLSLGA